MPYLGVKPADEFTSKDLNGEQLILDADADTTITADTDDQIDIRIAGADDFQFTANTFTAQSGSTIAAQALTATSVTSTGAVSGTTGTFTSTVDINGSELILDANANTSITADTDDQIDIKIAGADDFQFTANTFTVLSGSTLAVASGATIANSGTATGFGSSTAVDSITAGSTQTQAGATALTGTINRITVSGTNGDGVKLPTAVAGSTCVIINGDSAQTIDVWPASGDKIQGGSTDAVDPTSIAPGTSREFYSIDAAEWLRDIPVGTVLQRVVINTTTGTNSTSTTEAATALTATISMLDAGSIVQVTAMGPWAVSRSSGSPTNMQGFLRLWESAVTSGTNLADQRIGYTYGLASQPPFAVAGGGYAAKVLDTPGDKAATTYVLGILTSVGSANLAQFNPGSLQATMILEEIAT